VHPLGAAEPGRFRYPAIVPRYIDNQKLRCHAAFDSRQESVQYGR
jgi:hypothetical protein